LDCFELEYQVINDPDKCNAVKAKIEETSCTVFCVQETKCTSFDHTFVRKFAPKQFNKFAYSPSNGVSDGIFMGWNAALFTEEVVYMERFPLTVSFTPVLNLEQ
jgi:hypothetical protein